MSGSPVGQFDFNFGGHLDLLCNYGRFPKWAVRGSGGNLLETFVLAFIGHLENSVKHFNSDMSS